MRRNHSKTTDRKAVIRYGWVVGVALIAINAGLATIAAPAEAAGSSCEATVTERLNRLKVEPSDIRSISCLADRRGGRDGGRVIGITAWVSLHSCQGNLVIDMSRHGQVRRVYGRGACDLGGAVETW
jgi:hypothetical protein